MEDLRVERGCQCGGAPSTPDHKSRCTAASPATHSIRNQLTHRSTVTGTTLCLGRGSLDPHIENDVINSSFDLFASL